MVDVSTPQEHALVAFIRGEGEFPGFLDFPITVPS